MACQNLERFDGENIPRRADSVRALAYACLRACRLVGRQLVGGFGIFLSPVEILLSPTVIICALVLYLWRRHDADISNIFPLDYHIAFFRATSRPGPNPTK